MNQTNPSAASAGESAGDYLLYGLNVRSDLPLGALVNQVVSPDLTVTWGAQRIIANDAPDGQILARLSFSDGRGYTHTQSASGYTLRFHAVCEFQIDCELRSVRVHLAPAGDPELAAILLAGNVMAFILALMGDGVLHASAVEIAGGALAFVGCSGSGKSTLAALFCAGGVKLITDDLLRLAMKTDQVGCFSSAAEIRLRPGSVGLAESFPAGATRSTADHRLAVRVASQADPILPLNAIIIPRPSRTCAALRLERLSASRGLYLLSSYPRVAGWQTQRMIRQQFEGLARVARSVPIYQAEIPWGPPFASDLPDRLVKAMRSGSPPG